MQTKIAVVTGSSQGIGEAITQKLLQEGYKVFGISRSGRGIKHKQFVSVKFDLMNLTQIPNLISQLPTEVNLLVNNAGHWVDKNIADMSLADIDYTLHLNFYAPVLLTHHLLPRISSPGIIINISSVMAIISDPSCSLYCASKAALDRFTSSLAKERRDLKVIGILPSGTNTPSMRASTSDPSGLMDPRFVADVVWQAVCGKYLSGSFIALINDRSRDEWGTRDQYTQVIDLG